MHIEDRLERAEESIAALMKIIAHISNNAPFPVSMLPFGAWAKGEDGTIYHHTERADYGGVERNIFVMDNDSDNRAWYSWKTTIPYDYGSDDDDVHQTPVRLMEQPQ